MTKPIYLTPQQLSIAARCISVRIFHLDQNRPNNWHKMETECYLTISDREYRAELEETYDALVKQY